MIQVSNEYNYCYFEICCLDINGPVAHTSANSRQTLALTGVQKRNKTDNCDVFRGFWDTCKKLVTSITKTTLIFETEEYTYYPDTTSDIMLTLQSSMEGHTDRNTHF